MPIIKRDKLIDKKKFGVLVMDENFEIFIVYIAVLKALLEIAEMAIHSFRLAQDSSEISQLAIL